jgi:hypothetical protein
LKVLSLPKLAVTDESEHDHRMIAIGLLFIGVLCDGFKSRQQLEAEIAVLRHQLNILSFAKIISSRSEMQAGPDGYDNDNPVE